MTSLLERSPRSRPDWTARIRPEDLPTPDDTWTAHSVLAAQTRIGELLEPADAEARPVGLYWFNQFYRSVTRGVIRDERRHKFGPRGDEFLDQLDVAFYRRYDHALRAGLAEDPSIAWAPLLRPARSRDGLPLAWALRGVHAHIIFDLPPAILEALITLGRTGPSLPDPHSPEYIAYNGMNEVIYDVALDALKANFAEGLPALALHFVRLPVDLMTLTYIKALRDAAWWRAEILWLLHREGNEQAIATTEAWFGQEVLWYNHQLQRLLDIRCLQMPRSFTHWVAHLFDPWHIRTRTSA